MTDAQILHAIGANLRRARHAANMTQEGLAEMAEIHWKTLGYVEAGKRDFGVTILARIALCLSVSGDQLLAGIKVPNTKHLQVLKAATSRKRRARS